MFYKRAAYETVRRCNGIEQQKHHKHTCTHCKSAAVGSTMHMHTYHNVPSDRAKKKEDENPKEIDIEWEKKEEMRKRNPFKSAATTNMYIAHKNIIKAYFLTSFSSFTMHLRMRKWNRLDFCSAQNNQNERMRKGEPIEGILHACSSVELELNRVQSVFVAIAFKREKKCSPPFFHYFSLHLML